MKSMSNKLNVESFLDLLNKSGLVEPDRLEAVLTKYPVRIMDADDSATLVTYLISVNAITKWQAEKLLQGRHKGFFLGKYRLLSLLGRGGMSSVFLAEHTVMRRLSAVKVLPKKRVEDSSYLARFHREAQAVALLDHPNIVRAYDVDSQLDGEKEIHFLVMEYVEGNSLHELVQKQGLIGFLDAAEYIRQAALGLQHAHESGLVHRDVKPGNLLVDLNGVVKVLDLGLARFFETDDDSESLTIMHDERVLGTADYLAPEQALDSHTVDARADIYGLGCTLYFLLTGRPPFNEGTLTQRLLAHQTKTPLSVEASRKDIPATLSAIIQKMMNKKADDRYTTSKEVADTFLAWIDDNADEHWRDTHPLVFVGPRKKEFGASSAAIPVFVSPATASDAAPTDVLSSNSKLGTSIVKTDTLKLRDTPLPPKTTSNSKSDLVDPVLSGFIDSWLDSDLIADPRLSKPEPVPVRVLSRLSKPLTVVIPPDQSPASQRLNTSTPSSTPKVQDQFPLTSPAEPSELSIAFLGCIMGGIVLVWLIVAFLGWFNS